ncbi:oligosaccharide flippase family protein [Desulfuromonas thiophila]|uniref:oligosaccharide flippase family protein n=1 Tax=Desulfuromonas thiophila TaxID=57664 RepID=UPI0024A9FF24|nr:oligosaccharide flippase family protein [Desulfuromonas thiophila]
MSACVHLRNLAFNWGGHAATLLVMFFLSPYIVGKLDAVSYGIWSLLNVLTGYMGIFDLGVRASVGRHVALYLGKDDPVGVDETIRAGFGFFSLVGGLILLVGIGLGWLFPVLFKEVGPEHYDTVRVLLPLMVVNVWLSAIAAINSSVLAAHDRFDIARGVDMAVLLVRTVGTIHVLEMGWGLWGLVFAIMAGNVCAVIGNRICAGWVHKGLRIFPFLYTRERFRELFSYGIPAAISNSAVKIIGQSDLVIVGLAISVSAVREYSVGGMLILYTYSFIKIINSTMFPSIQKSIARGLDGEAKHLFYRQVRVSLSVGLVVYLGYAFYSEPFVNLWMLQDNFDLNSVKSSATVMSILAVANIPVLFTNPCKGYLAALGYVRFNAAITFTEAVVNMFFSIFFVVVLDLGLAGVALGTLAGRLLVPTILVPCHLAKNGNIPLNRYISSSVIPGIVAGILFSLVCSFSMKIWYPETWLMFFTHVFILLFLWAPLFYFILLPDDYRKKINSKYKQIESTKF